MRLRMKCPKCNAYVDDELVPLIKEMNKLGLKTKYCCSGHKGNYAYVMCVGDLIKCVEYGYFVERHEAKGRDFIFRWKIPKYAPKTIRLHGKKRKRLSTMLLHSGK